MDGIDYKILKILQKNARETASNISKEIHLSVSALMLKSFQSDMLWNNALALVYGIGYSFLFQLTLIGLSFILIRKNAEDASVDRSCIAFNNVGFIAMPVIGAVFGDI